MEARLRPVCHEQMQNAAVGVSAGNAHGGLPGEAPAIMSAPGADLSLPLHGSDMEMMEQISNDLVRGSARLYRSSIKGFQH